MFSIIFFCLGIAFSVIAGVLVRDHEFASAVTAGLFAIGFFISMAESGIKQAIRGMQKKPE